MTVLLMSYILLAGMFLTGGIIIIATGFDAVFNKITNARLQAQNS